MLLFCVDAIYLVVKTIGAMINGGAVDYSDGLRFRELASSIRFDGVSGPVVLDADSERQPSFGLFTTSQNGTMYQVIDIDTVLNADRTISSVISVSTSNFAESDASVRREHLVRRLSATR